jgi:hypothetical protein
LKLILIASFLILSFSEELENYNSNSRSAKLHKSIAGIVSKATIPFDKNRPKATEEKKIDPPKSNLIYS